MMDNRLSEMDRHLCAALRSITDLTRMLEAVRYPAGLGKQQWERVERARKIEEEAEQFLASLSEAEGQPNA
ncbi:hypothetical protein JYP46_22025 [Nitratireductor aquimarinus]|uniref:hypothetical protein n=1 Tax=Nitratireductor aquimarinus TaxID=889300 RepID=UPI0019D37294|nr:hypothetical protein [Nitratireductor aquimarinus]MBN7759501.1 hypothetical protein [Nitratireductor aquimarinus]